MNRAKEVNGFARKVKALAKKAPDQSSRKDLNRAAYTLLVRQTLSDDEKDEIVYEALKNGCVLQSEVADETGLNLRFVIDSLRRLESLNKIKVNRRTATLSSRGRPANYYEVIE